MLKGSEKAWLGSKYAAENAADLLSAARTSADSEKYGVATALAILSAEESAKSIALLVESAGLEKTAHPLKAYFKNHKVKHEAGIIYATMAKVALYAQGVISTIELEFPDKSQEWPSILMTRITEDLQKYFESGADPFNEMRAWAESADQAKQNGFYVGLVDNQWSRPCDITRQEYDTRVLVAESLAYCVGKAFEYLSHAEVKKAYAQHLLTSGGG